MAVARVGCYWICVYISVLDSSQYSKSSPRLQSPTKAKDFFFMNCECKRSKLMGEPPHEKPPYYVV